jgi:hypothetical protein
MIFDHNVGVVARSALWQFYEQLFRWQLSLKWLSSNCSIVTTSKAAAEGTILITSKVDVFSVIGEASRGLQMQTDLFV